MIIDPVLEKAKRDANLVKELGFTLKYACEYEFEKFKNKADFLLGDVVVVVIANEFLICRQRNFRVL